VLVLPDEKVPIARLLSFLEHGERMARDCAARQALLVTDDRSRRFLTSQSRQEAMHAYVFRGAIAWLAPRHLGETPVLPALETYRSKLDDAFSRREFYETVLAEQIILEGLGEAILNRIEAGLAKRDAPFAKLRRIVLLQEEAHHAFGERIVSRAMDAGVIDPTGLRRKAQEYLALAQTMVLTLADLFATIDEDSSSWAADVKRQVPEWLRSAE
jgi:hypothetical protein